MRTVTKLIRSGIRAKREKRPERIWEAIVVNTGEKINVTWWRPCSDYQMLLNAETLNALMPEQYPLLLIDTPEEGD